MKEPLTQDEACLALLGGVLEHSKDTLTALPGHVDRALWLHKRAMKAVQKSMKALAKLLEEWEAAEATAEWADSTDGNHRIPLILIASRLALRPNKLRELLFGTIDDNLVRGLLGQEYRCPLCSSFTAQSAPPRKAAKKT